MTYIPAGLGRWRPTGTTSDSAPPGYDTPWGVKNGQPVDPTPYVNPGSGLKKGKTIPWDTFCTLYPTACPPNWSDDPGDGGPNDRAMPPQPRQACPPGQSWKYLNGEWVCVGDRRDPPPRRDPTPVYRVPAALPTPPRPLPAPPAPLPFRVPSASGSCSGGT